MFPNFEVKKVNLSGHTMKQEETNISARYSSQKLFIFSRLLLFLVI